MENLREQYLKEKNKLLDNIFIEMDKFEKKTGTKVTSFSSDYTFNCLSIFVFSDIDKVTPA